MGTVCEELFLGRNYNHVKDHENICEVLDIPHLRAEGGVVRKCLLSCSLMLLTAASLSSHCRLEISTAGPTRRMVLLQHHNGNKILTPADCSPH